MSIPTHRGVSIGPVPIGLRVLGLLHHLLLLLLLLLLSLLLLLLLSLPPRPFPLLLLLLLPLLVLGQFAISLAHQFLAVEFALDLK